MESSQNIQESVNNFTAKHKNGFMRFITVSIGLPLTILVYLYPLEAFLLPRIIFACLTIFLILETYKLLPSTMKTHLIYALISGLIFPFIALLSAFMPMLIPYQYQIGITFFVIIILIFSIRVIFSASASHIIEKISGLLFLAIYPGLFSAYYIMLPNLTNSLIHMIIVTGIVYSNDGMAYIIGRFFGKRSKKPLIPISSGKTAIGFISGFVSGVLFFYIIYTIASQHFSENIVYALVFACLINCAGMLGDLFESALKRSANSKDSGSIMLGRGGALDTFDSLIMASAMYYILYPIFF